MRLNRVVLQQLCDRAKQDVDDGLAFGGVEGCTLAIGYQGELVYEQGFGQARPDTPILMLSVTKTVLEGALWKLFSRGLKPETPVVEFLPEFMGGTQPEITIAMVETHLAGFAWHRLDYPDAADHHKRLAAFSAWRLEQPPGRYEYNPVNGAWVLAEIIERVAGRDYLQFLKDEVLLPLQLGDVATVSLGEPHAEQAKVLRHLDFMGGYCPDPARRIPMVYGLDTPEGLALGTPGVGAVGTASGLVRLYQAYLHNPGRLWDPKVLANARDHVRVLEPDPAGRPMRRSLSFVLAGPASERYGERSFFGPAVSEHAFGHQGQGGQIAWADPASGLSFSYLTNTVVFPPGGCFHPRARHLSGLAARVLES